MYENWKNRIISVPFSSDHTIRLYLACNADNIDHCFALFYIYEQWKKALSSRGGWKSNRRNIMLPVAPDWSFFSLGRISVAIYCKLRLYSIRISKPDTRACMYVCMHAYVIFSVNHESRLLTLFPVDFDVLSICIPGPTIAYADYRGLRLRSMHSRLWTRAKQLS